MQQLCRVRDCEIGFRGVTRCPPVPGNVPRAWTVGIASYPRARLPPDNCNNNCNNGNYYCYCYHLLATDRAREINNDDNDVRRSEGRAASRGDTDAAYNRRRTARGGCRVATSLARTRERSPVVSRCPLYPTVPVVLSAKISTPP